MCEQAIENDHPKSVKVLLQHGDIPEEVQERALRDAKANHSTVADILQYENVSETSQAPLKKRKTHK